VVEAAVVSSTGGGAPTPLVGAELPIGLAPPPLTAVESLPPPAPADEDTPSDRVDPSIFTLGAHPRAKASTGNENAKVSFIGGFLVPERTGRVREVDVNDSTVHGSKA
jgi:hypothetical protein